MSEEGDIIPFGTSLDPIHWASTLHKIKTPLTIIKSRLDQSLREEHSSPEIINELHKEINKLVGTINGLGNESQVQPLVIEKIYLNKLASFIIQRFQLVYKDLSLELNIEEEIFIYGNKDRIYELIANLIENACKYTERGYVSLSIKRIDDGIIISITDTGIGIAKEAIPKIFNNFYRSDKVKGRAGYGMGLFIVKQIIETLNGEIEVKSTLGQGSTFLIRLPL